MTEPETATATPPRTGASVVLEQEARYDYSGPVTKLRQRLVLVPPVAHGGQRRSGWDLTVDGVDRHRVTTRTDPFGNLVLSVGVAHVPSWVRFAVRTEVRTATATRAHRVSPDRRYLSPTRLTTADDRIAALAAEAGPDAAALSALVQAALTYEWGVTGVRTTAAEALAGGRGVCQDYAHLFLAAWRALGLPARYVSGHLLGEGGSHAWVEVLTPDPRRSNSWLAEAWDPTHDRRAGAGYLTVAVGRDYTDVAPLSGTFDGDGVTGTLTARKRAAQAA